MDAPKKSFVFLDMEETCISCPKCQKEFFINYNTNEVKEFVR